MRAVSKSQTSLEDHERCQTHGISTLLAELVSIHGGYLAYAVAVYARHHLCGLKVTLSATALDRNADCSFPKGLITYSRGSWVGGGVGKYAGNQI
jgi:hypothetical protein